MEAVLVSELAVNGLRRAVADDHSRRTLTVSATDRVLRVSGDDLLVLGEWPLAEEAPGVHATRADLSLVSGSDRVALVEAGGGIRWSFAHAPWEDGGFEAGCAWFDARGRPFAVVPREEYDGVEAVALDIATGRPEAGVTLATAPAGVEPIHHPDGWVGLSVGEGQDAALAWWLRAADDGQLEVLDAGWSEWILADVDRTGERVLTTPHVGGPLTVRGFPDLQVLREIAAPEEEDWDFFAAFVGEYVVAQLIPSERMVAIDADGVLHELDAAFATIVPAAESWLTVDETHLRRWRLAV